MSRSIDNFVDEIRHHLDTEVLGRSVIAFKQTESTNLQARAGIAQNAATGTLYLADRQTRGRGRMGRRWEAEAGSNLTFSVILRPPGEQVQHLPVVAALALHRAVKPFVAPANLALKWPNDLLIDGRKCAGMLLEHVSQGAANGVVLGIGLNVNQSHFSHLEAPNATSILLATGQLTPRAPLLCTVLAELENALHELSASGPRVLLRQYEHLMYRLGEQVSFFLPDQEQHVEGRIQGIEADGALRLETSSGIQRYYAGDVTTHTPDGAG